MRRESIRNLGRIISPLRNVIAHLGEAGEHWQYGDQYLQLWHERREYWQDRRSELHESFELLVDVRKLAQIHIRWKSERPRPARVRPLRRSGHRLRGCADFRYPTAPASAKGWPGGQAVQKGQALIADLSDQRFSDQRARSWSRRSC
jgi:hypothetical protein